MKQADQPMRRTMARIVTTDYLQRFANRDMDELVEHLDLELPHIAAGLLGKLAASQGLMVVQPPPPGHSYALVRDEPTQTQKAG